MSKINCSSLPPRSVSLIKQLDKIQCKAVILGDTSDTYVNNMKALRFQAVHFRHIKNRMVMVHKILNNMIAIDFSKYFSIRNLNRQLTVPDPGGGVGKGGTCPSPPKLPPNLIFILIFLTISVELMQG